MRSPRLGWCVERPGGLLRRTKAAGTAKAFEPFERFVHTVLLY